MTFHTKIWILTILACLAYYSSNAQRMLNIERADFIESGTRKNGGKYNKVIGNVVFSQQNIKIYCDSAYLFRKNNRLEAYGRVKIKQGDSLTITGNKLLYSGKDQVAKFRKNVVFKNQQFTLYTDFLDFNRKTQIAYYFNKGRLVDSVNQITSHKGYYQTISKLMSFKKRVKLVNPDFTLKSDSLVYNTKTRIVNFVAPTRIVDVEGNVYNYENGQYDTNIKFSDLFGGEFETKDYILKGDRLRLNELAGYYKATGNVVLISKKDRIEINGDIGELWKDTRITKIYGHALMKVFIDQDTLYLSADTLVSIDSNVDSLKRVLAYHKVKFFRTGMQGKADSLSYHLSDSILFLYRDPVLWLNNENTQTQVLADSINMMISNGTLNQMNMAVNCFVVMEDSLGFFNQIKGRQMTTYLNDSQIDKVDVEGNGESLYFAISQEDSKLAGMNHVRCSSMLINFENGELTNVVFYTNPEARFIPPHEIVSAESRLAGFKWRILEKPSLQEVLYLVGVNDTIADTPVTIDRYNFENNIRQYQESDLRNELRPVDMDAGIKEELKPDLEEGENLLVPADNQETILDEQNILVVPEEESLTETAEDQELPLSDVSITEKPSLPEPR